LIRPSGAVRSRAVTVDEAFAQLRGAFPSKAAFQGTHFGFAQSKGVCLIERRLADRYFYWLLFEGQAKLVHASRESKLAPLRTVGDSFTPKAHD
jgi:hypothetical protein